MNGSSMMNGIGSMVLALQVLSSSLSELNAYLVLFNFFFFTKESVVFGLLKRLLQETHSGLFFTDHLEIPFIYSLS